MLMNCAYSQCDFFAHTRWSFIYNNYYLHFHLHFTYSKFQGPVRAVGQYCPGLMIFTFVVFVSVFQCLVKRLTGKNISEMTYFVSHGA